MRDALLLNVADVAECSLAMAPGAAPWAAVWLQGCRKRCRGCSAKPYRNVNRIMKLIPSRELAWWALGIPGIAGVMISGGEPFLQAVALLQFARTIGEKILLGAYSGYTLAELRENVVPASAELLSRLDLLIDGPFKKDLADPALAYRGSSNQEIHLLSRRSRVLTRDASPSVNCHVRVEEGRIVLTGSGADAFSRILMVRGIDGHLCVHRSHRQAKPCARQEAGHES